MYKSKVLIIFVILLCLLFIVFEFNENYWMAEVSRSLIIPFITAIYLINKKNKSVYFTLFLVAFSVSDLISVLGYVFPVIPYDLEYYLGNSLYITAYVALSYEIIISLNFKYILKYFKLHIAILFMLNIYANYVLLNIVKEHVTGFDLRMEFFYNIFTLLLLTVSLLNYFYRDDKKAMVLFLGSLCITFSEVMQIAYFYISDKDLLNITYSILLILAFYFFYSQSKLEYEELLIIA